jgi:hypothetical protein
MKRLLRLPLIVLALGSVCLAQDQRWDVMPAEHRALLQSHCYKCHDAKQQSGQVRLDDLSFTISNIETAERWQKILNVLNAGEMPPEEEKPLPNQAKTEFLDDLSNLMVAARKKLNDQGGAITMRRLNRREYGNTLRELLGVQINVSELPSDSGTGGFDTAGQNLFMSATQIEQYHSLGREALEEAFALLAVAGAEQSFRYEPEESNERFRKQVQENRDALERAKKWASEIESAAARPENAELVAKLRKQFPRDDAFRREWKQIPGAPAPEEFGFQTVENNADKANRALGYQEATGTGYMRPYDEYLLSLPHQDEGAWLTIMGGLNSAMTLFVPWQWNETLPGNYRVRMRLAHADDAPPERCFIEFGIHPRDGQILSTQEVTGTLAQPQIIEIPLTLTSEHKTRENRQLFIREKGAFDHFTQTRQVFGAAKKQNGIGPTAAIWVDWMEIVRVSEAAKPTPSGLAALDLPLNDTTQSLSGAELQSAYTRFATVAFRGHEPSDRYIQRLISIYDTLLESGAKPKSALKDTLSIVLASPMFLYLAEPAVDGQPRTLTDLELATRLSYFLWSAPPDEKLLELARSRELSKPAVLVDQTTRLLDDPRANEFVHGFVEQWLGMERFEFFEVNRPMYPRFDDSTRLAAKNEVYETFAHILRHNAPVSDLLKADYVVIDPVLAHFYGVEESRDSVAIRQQQDAVSPLDDEHAGVSGFRKVPVSADSPRGGLLGMAAINFMGGNGEHTSPVERGVWVLRKLLNDPPPPAPANVPQIARLAGKVLTTRERLQAHQEDPQCASCHRKIDPIGFGLENFDAVGQWRTEDTYQVKDENGKPVTGASKTWTIQASAALHAGPTFQNYFELRDIIASRSDAFAAGFSAALIEYAIGRSVAFSDEPLIEEMVQSAKKQNLSTREFIHALTASETFRRK